MPSPSRIILHVDMDAFFASVEVLDNPSLAGKPVIVGGAPAKHGVVAAASYEVRRFGVRSAMPTATALRLCPHAILLPARGDRYAEVSARIMTILRSFTPLVEPASVDEAFLDVTASAALFGDGPAIARRVKARIRAETGLACSIGVAPNRFLAKLASDLDKPDGLTVVPPDRAAEFIAPLPVGRIWGVGPRTEEHLRALGIGTIGKLASFPTGKLERRLGSSASHLQALARGEDASPIVTEQEPKSLSRETTFAVFLEKKEEAEAALLDLADDVAERLRGASLVASTVTVKVRDGDFVTVTRSRALAEATDLGEVLYATARDLLARRVSLRGRKIRLLGVAAGDLSARDAIAPQLLPDRRRERMRRAAGAVDDIRRKHGEKAVLRGRMIPERRLKG